MRGIKERMSDNGMAEFLRKKLSGEDGSGDDLPTPERRKELRLSFGLSLRVLAERLGTTATTISSWERGVNRPSGELRERYAEFCRTAERILKEAESTTEGESEDGQTEP
jgi:transcriptional regulator with XRE-family HTH domain